MTCVWIVCAALRSVWTKNDRMEEELNYVAVAFRTHNVPAYGVFCVLCSYLLCQRVYSSAEGKPDLHLQFFTMLEDICFPGLFWVMKIKMPSVLKFISFATAKFSLCQSCITVLCFSWPLQLWMVSWCLWLQQVKFEPHNRIRCHWKL